MIDKSYILTQAKEYIKAQNLALKTTPYYIDEPTALKVIGFVSLLKHTAGKYAGVNFQLLPFQIKFLIDIIATFKRDTKTRRYKTAMLFLPRKNGKALALDTPIPTPQGFVSMADLKVGDEVFSADGTPTKITFISQIFTNHDCYKVSFSDGSHIISDAGHIWRVNSAYHYIGKKRKTLELTTEQMLNLGVNYQREDGKIENAFKVEVAGAAQFNKKELKIHPYLLGLWLGDGSSYDARITIDSHKDDIMAKLEQIGVKLKLVPSDNKNVYYAYTAQKFNKNGFGSTLRKLGLYKNKHIPLGYLTSDISDRLELLQGLMDSDGYVSKAGECGFCSINETLAQNVLLLVRSLGLKATLKTGDAKINGRFCSKKYKVIFFAPKSLKISCVSFKQNRLKQSLSPRSKSKAIIAIEKIPSVPTKCIQVEHPSHLYLASDAFTPTHNTELLAALLNYFLFADSEQGKEIYCAANETEQAKIIFNAAQTMINQNEILNKLCNIYKSTKTIEAKSTFLNFVKVLTANADTKDGLKPYVFVYDELHAAKDGELWRVLEEGTINRQNPLSIIISTAGYNQNSIMKQKYDYAKQVSQGIIKDDSFYSMIFEANANSWQDEREWIKANPALNYGVLLENLRDRYLKTKGNAEEEMSFKTKHLNIWCNTSAAWISDEIWQEAPKLKEPANLEWYGGLDLASVSDITAYVLIGRVDIKNAPCLYFIKPFFWVPEQNAKERARRDRVPYLNWINQGFIQTTPGNVVDYDYLRRDIVKIHEAHNIKGSAYDRWNSQDIMVRLQNDDGLPFSQFGQGFASMSAPSKEIYSLAMQKRLIHNDNPVLRWMLSNVELERDAADNIKASKKKSREKIDGIVALIMAYAMMCLMDAQTPPPEPSIRFL